MPASEMHLEYHIPTRGIMGLKNILVAKTRGTVIMHHVFSAYAPADEQTLLVAPHGSLVAFEDGTSTGYAIFMTQERGELFIGPSVEVYRGMVVGQNSRDEDLDVNVCKEKHLSNMRAPAPMRRWSSRRHGKCHWNSPWNISARMNWLRSPRSICASASGSSTRTTAGKQRKAQSNHARRSAPWRAARMKIRKKSAKSARAGSPLYLIGYRRFALHPSRN